MIYIQTGLKTKKLTEFSIKVSPFEWLSQYEPKQVTGDKKQFKQNKADYFISGYIVPNEDGKHVRGNDSLIRRDLIVMDYDDIDSAEQFKQLVHQSLQDFQYMLYTTISHTDKKPRYRLIIEPSRPLLRHEYKYIQKEITAKIGLKMDDTALTWSQLQGLPVSDIEIINIGEKYPVIDDIPIDEPKTLPGVKSIEQRANNGKLEHNKAIEIMHKYVENDSNNLQDYNNSISAIAVIAKSVRDEAITYDTATECVRILAMGNVDWERGNIEKLNDFLGNQDIRTQATFLEKFQYVVSYEVKYDQKGKAYKTLPNMENMVRATVPLIYNEFTKNIEMLQGNGIPTLLTSDDKAMITMAIAKRYGVRISKDDMNVIVINLAKEKKYHPIKRLIEKNEWDKKPRAETFFIRHLGVDDNIYNREITRKWLLGAVYRIYKEGIKFDMTLVLQGEQGIGKSTAINKLAMGYYTSINEDINKDTILKILNFWIVELEEMDLTTKADNKKVKAFLSAQKDDIRRPYKDSTETFYRHNAFIGTTNMKSYLKDVTGNRRYFPMRVNREQVTDPIFTVKKAYIQQIWAEVFTWYQHGESLVCSDETNKYVETLRDEAMIINQTLEDLKTYLDIEIPITFHKADRFSRHLYIQDMMTNGESKQFKGIATQKRQNISTREIMEELYNMKIAPGFRGDMTSRNIAQCMLQISEWEKKVFRRNGIIIRGYTRV